MNHNLITMIMAILIVVIIIIMVGREGDGEDATSFVFLLACLSVCLLVSVAWGLGAVNVDERW